MRIFRPADAPAWLTQVLASIERLFREIMPAPLRLRDYAAAELPAASDHGQGLVYDRDAATLRLSDGTGWRAFQPLDSDLSAIAALSTTAFGRALLTLADPAALRTAAALGTAATQNIGTSGASLPLLNGANNWSAMQRFAAIRQTGSVLARFENSGAAAPAGATGNGVELYTSTGGFNGGWVSAYDRTPASPGYAPLNLDASVHVLWTRGARGIGASYAGDVAAAAGGVPIGGIYRNGSALMVRVS